MTAAVPRPFRQVDVFTDEALAGGWFRRVLLERV